MLSVSIPNVAFGSLLIGGTRNGLYKPKEFHGTGTPIINMGELFAFARLSITPPRRLRVTQDELTRFAVQPDDLLFARRSLVAEGAGRCCWIRAVAEPTVFESSIIRARLNPLIADSAYYFYLFSSQVGRDLMSSILRQVAVSGITGTDLVNLQVPNPPIETQRAISGLLSALDDKIELNRRMNETLEAMARALFRSWFVDFDPVRAKSEGRPTGLPADLDALFPSEFEDSPLGEIPKGWSVRPLDEIADFLNGLALQKFPAVEGEPWLPVIKIAQLRKGITPDCDRASFGVPPNYIIQNGDLLFSWSGSLGVQVWTHGQGALNQHLFKVTSNEFQQWFVYQWLMEHLTHFRHVAASKATTMGHIQRSHLTGALCVVPDERVLSAANDQVGLLHAQVVQNSLEAGRLASTRDELLPRLLSGEIEVADVEGRES